MGPGGVWGGERGGATSPPNPPGCAEVLKGAPRALTVHRGMPTGCLPQKVHVDNEGCGSTTQGTTGDGALQHRAQQGMGLYNTGHNGGWRSTAQGITGDRALGHRAQRGMALYNTGHNGGWGSTTQGTTGDGALRHRAQRGMGLYNTGHNGGCGSTTQGTTGDGALQHRAQLKPVWTPVAIFGSLGVCIPVPASRHWLISYSPIHLT